MATYPESSQESSASNIAMDPAAEAGPHNSIPDDAQLTAMMEEYVRRGLPLPVANIPAPAPAPAPAYRRMLEKLQTYNGSRAELRGWLLQARAKVEDLAGVGYNQNQVVAYLMSRMEGSALERMTPWMEDENRLNTSNEFLAQLSNTFGDTHREQSAANRLTNLQQRTKTWRAFTQEFKQLLAEGGTLTASLSEELKIVNLRKGMSDKTYETAGRFAIGSKTLNEYIDRVQEVVDDLDARRMGSFRAPYQAYVSNHHDPMDIDRISSRRADTSSKPVNNQKTVAKDNYRLITSYEPDKNQFSRRTESDAGKKRAKWVAYEVRQDRRKKGVCFRCGAGGHREAQCPYLPARRPDDGAVRYTNIHDNTPPDLESEDEEEDIADSMRDHVTDRQQSLKD